MIDVEVVTEIAAPAETVWEVLTELTAYRWWNPFIRRARGSLAVGETVHLRVRTSRGIPLVFSAVIEAHDERRLRWRGCFVTPWLGTGVHELVVEAIGAHRARLVHRERFTGLLPRLARRLLEREVRRGFTEMNDAVAARAEALAPSRFAWGPSDARA